MALRIIILVQLMLFGQMASAQTAEEIPVPDFYGIYAIDNGKLFALIEGASSEQPSFRSIEVFSFQSGSAKIKRMIQFTEKVRFIVFDQASGEIARSLSLYRLPYGRNLIQGSAAPEIMGGQTRTLPIGKWLAARMKALWNPLVAKPVPGQPQTVEVLAQFGLAEGLYGLHYIRSQGFDRTHYFVWFVIGSPELGNPNPVECFDVYFAGGLLGQMEMSDYRSMHGPSEFLELTPDHFRPCSPSADTAPPAETATSLSDMPASSQPTAAQPPASDTTTCGDYDACFQSGQAAFQAGEWEQALRDFEAASRLQPSNPAPWAWLGTAYLVIGRYQEAPSTWDKALQLGASLATEVCRDRFLGCDKGVFFFGKNEVSFVDQNRQQLFKAHPSEVEVLGIKSYALTPSPYFGLRIAGRTYNLAVFPQGVRCQVNQQGYVECPEAGQQQQLAAANYISDTIPKLASGAFADSEAITDLVKQPVVPGGTIGRFRHGTLVTKLPSGSLVASPTPQDATHTHPGVDIVADCGTPIYAIADGTVVDTVASDGGTNFDSLGYMVIVKHSQPVAGKDAFSAYFHMNQPPSVQMNDTVIGGQTQIGVVGKTGVATGCHLHLEVRHFSSRFLENLDWNQPPNIYGTGDQTKSTVFLDNWEDPEPLGLKLQ